ncbi:Phosphatidylinositol transfer protein domain containing protein [Aphelenchoides bicaudatus]|nr:Phosphatidylinositol transfer protein domain containing protein [Aphelenchoides bicaudatus]
MIIKEYRIVMPLSVEEFQIGQLYSVTEASKNETGGGEGVEILKNEPFSGFPLIDGFDCGQYTHKVYHLQSKVPAIVRKVAPSGSMAIHERSWNAYPYCRTELSNPDYMGEKFFIKIETMHVNDRGTSENVHNLPPDLLAKRSVVNINIANDKEFLHHSDLKSETSPQLFYSRKTRRGRLDPNTWRQNCEPVMCAYKLVTVYFKWFGLQSMVENHAHKQYPRLFSKFHREVFCWIDNWWGLTISDIRELERVAQLELNEARTKGSIRGMSSSI